MEHSPEPSYTGWENQLEMAVRRMLEPFEDGPGFGSLKNLFLQPFVNPEETDDIFARFGDDPLNFELRECSEMHIFDGLLGCMPLEKKASHVGPLVDMFKCLLARHKSICGTAKSCLVANTCVMNFTWLYVRLLRLAEDDDSSGELVQFVEYVLRNIIWDDFKRFLRGMDPSGMDYLLTCFSKERFHAYGIRESNFLMLNNMLSVEKGLSAVLIRHGFRYSFHREYYGVCVWKLISPRSVHERQPQHIIHSDFMNSGNLRMQMAVEILLYFLYEHVTNRELLCMLWQSLPDPFITPDELHHLMEPFVKNSVLQDACVRYRNLFPEVPEVKQPRSLKHLARVRIRESMVRAHTISEKAVRSLGLPKRIEDYLWKLEAF